MPDAVTREWLRLNLQGIKSKRFRLADSETVTGAVRGVLYYTCL